MVKKTLKFFARYVLVGILPSAILGLLVKKLEGASHKAQEHADEVLLDASLVSVVVVLLLGFLLIAVRWLVVVYGVNSGLLILTVTWLAGLATVALVVLPSFWAWKRYGLHYGLLMVTAIVLGITVLGTILLVLGIFFVLGLKILR